MSRPCAYQSTSASRALLACVCFAHDAQGLSLDHVKDLNAAVVGRQWEIVSGQHTALPRLPCHC